MENIRMFKYFCPLGVIEIYVIDEFWFRENEY